jgi:hypothetical protein
MARRAQLRSYVVRDGQMDAFMAAWKGGVIPLRRQFGFTIDGAWLDREANRFVWVVGYDGPGTFDEAAAAYYASPERATMDPDPGSFLVSMDTVMLDTLELD